MWKSILHQREIHLIQAAFGHKEMNWFHISNIFFTVNTDTSIASVKVSISFALSWNSIQIICWWMKDYFVTPVSLLLVSVLITFYHIPVPTLATTPQSIHQPPPCPHNKSSQIPITLSQLSDNGNNQKLTTIRGMWLRGQTHGLSHVC